MKIVLAQNIDEVRNEYICFLSEIPEKDYDPTLDLNKSNFLDFDGIVYDGEVDEIYIPSLIEYIQRDKISIYLKKWISLCSINGTIIIGGTDIFQIANDLINCKINEHDINSFLYPKKACYSMNQVKAELEDNNLKIIELKLIGYKYIIKAQRIK